MLVAGAVAVLASGCSAQVKYGWLPSTPDTTNQTRAQSLLVSQSSNLG